ncbi:MAG TPA: His-Xaa-Ser system radical SAM maturase HxsC [Arachidicoccus sp.]|nr:His-Xaa-Ser system radical SAM maturase HxsC [Arachidicoccus sp.]
MLLKTRGRANGIFEPIIAKITRDIFHQDKNQILVIQSVLNLHIVNSFNAILSTGKLDGNEIKSPFISEIPFLDHLNEGDIIMLNPSGIINTLYRQKSYQNFLLVTERCNSNCLMCSQPPKDRDDIPFRLDINTRLIQLIPKDCAELCITGGEPTLLGKSFFQLISLLTTSLPNTELHCLTNGRSFGWKLFTKQLKALNTSKLMFGVPLYSDYYQLHDYIVQARNAFNQTMLGLYNLAESNQRIELRIVLHCLSVERLPQLAKFIYKNIPFVEHITFMGLENEGYTPFNMSKLWIDPFDYMTELKEAVMFLAARGMNVSIYNLPLCLQPEILWQFNKKSISDWKNIYLDICKNCTQKNKCGGFFASSIKQVSKHIVAI